MSGIDMRGLPANDESLLSTWSSFLSSTIPRCASAAKELDSERGEKGGPKGGGTGPSMPSCCKRGSAPGGVRRRARSSPGWSRRVITTNPRSSLSGLSRCCWTVAASESPIPDRDGPPGPRGHHSHHHQRGLLNGRCRVSATSAEMTLPSASLPLFDIGVDGVMTMCGGCFSAERVEPIGAIRRICATRRVRNAVSLRRPLVFVRIGCLSSAVR